MDIFENIPHMTSHNDPLTTVITWHKTKGYYGSEDLKYDHKNLRFYSDTTVERVWTPGHDYSSTKVILRRMLLPDGTEMFRPVGCEYYRFPDKWFFSRADALEALLRSLEDVIKTYHHRNSPGRRREEAQMQWAMELLKEMR